MTEAALQPAEEQAPLEAVINGEMLRMHPEVASGVLLRHRCPEHRGKYYLVS